MKEKFLLIGGNGLVGSAVANLLIKKKYNVTVLSRSKRNINSNKIRWIKADYYSKEIGKLINKQYDIVVNFIVYKPKQAARDIKFFKKRIKKYYFISSTSLYKQTKNKINETSKTYDGRWPYAKNKYKCEKIFLKAIKKGFSADIIRAGHIYSKNSLPTPFPYSGYEYINFLINAKYAILPFSINSKWSLLHNEDFAKNFVKVLTSKIFSFGNIINIASEKQILWKNIIKIYLKCLNKNISFKKTNPKILPKKITIPITADRAKNCCYNNIYYKKNFGKFIENKNINSNLKFSVKNYLQKKNKNKLNIKILNLFFILEKSNNL